MVNQSDQPESQEEEHARIPPKASLSRSWYTGETIADEMMIQAAFQKLKCIKSESFVRKLVTCVESKVSTLDDKFTTLDDELYRRYKRRAEDLNKEEVKKSFLDRISKYRQYLDQ